MCLAVVSIPNRDFENTLSLTSHSECMYNNGTKHNGHASNATRYMVPVPTKHINILFCALEMPTRNWSERRHILCVCIQFWMLHRWWTNGGSHFCVCISFISPNRCSWLSSNSFFMHEVAIDRASHSVAYQFEAFKSYDEEEWNPNQGSPIFDLRRNSAQIKCWTICWTVSKAIPL